ncbi:MAG: tetratricopeptide repeat protein [Bacteroidales bacterium]|jgi:tetratricopeptide (TPR) repeat protein|nr:tetratricopeptide repeat protein [Bacteroidales bacterium]
MKSLKNQNPKQPQVSKNRFQTVYPLLVFCFSFLLYFHSINFKYTMFDDDGLLMNNKEFFTNNGDLKTIFTTDAFLKTEGTFYRPIQNISFLIDVTISGGMDMRMFHFTNVLLFALIGISLYFLLLRFKISHLTAFLGTLLYLSHPLLASSVAWIPARGDLLLTLFSILTFIFWIQFLHNKKYKNLILSWLFFTLALFSKETAILLPLLFLVYYLTFESKFKIDFKLLLFGTFLLCTGIVWFVLRASFIQIYDTELTTDLFLRNLLGYPVGISMFAVPYDFSTAPEFTFAKILLGSILLVMILVMSFVKSSHSRGKKLFYLLWFLLLLFPTFFAKTKEWDYLDHRFLLPIIGIFLFVLSFIQNINKRIILIISTVLILIFSATSILKSQAYSNPYAFCEALKYNTNKPEAYHFLKGNLAQISEKYEKALKEYNAAISYRPDHIKSLNNRGIVKQKLGDFKGAFDDYNKVIDLGHKNYHIFKNRGDVRLQLSDYKGAIEDYGLALDFEQHAEIYYIRGEIYRRLEENEKALEEFNRYISEGYADPEIYTLTGITFGKIGDIENSIVCFTKALEMDSNYTFAYYNRAYAKFISSDYAGSLSDCKKLLVLDSEYPNAQTLRSEVMKKME